MNTKKVKLFLLGAITATIIILIVWYLQQPITDITPVKTKDIVTEVKKQLAPVDSSIYNLTKEYKKSRDSLTDLKMKWYAAVQENKRLRLKGDQLAVKNTSFAPEKQDNELIISNGSGVINEPINTTYSAQDYITDLQTASQIADSLCAGTIAHFEVALIQSDSLKEMERNRAEIYKAGMDKLLTNDALKDQLISSLKKENKNYKIQNIGLKAAAVTAIALVIKNNL